MSGGTQGASSPSVTMPVRMTRVLGPVAFQRFALSVVDLGVQKVKANRALGHDGVPKEGWVWLQEAMDDLYTHGTEL
jgi:hypothetical protein